MFLSIWWRSRMFPLIMCAMLPFNKQNSLYWFNQFCSWRLSISLTGCFFIFLCILVLLVKPRLCTHAKHTYRPLWKLSQMPTVAAQTVQGQPVWARQLPPSHPSQPVSQWPKRWHWQQVAASPSCPVDRKTYGLAPSLALDCIFLFWWTNYGPISTW